MGFSERPLSFEGSKPRGLGLCWPRKAAAGDFSCASKLPPVTAASESPATPAVSIFNESRRVRSFIMDLPKMKTCLSYPAGRCYPDAEANPVNTGILSLHERIDDQPDERGRRHDRRLGKFFDLPDQYHRDYGQQDGGQVGDGAFAQHH